MSDQLTRMLTTLLTISRLKQKINSFGKQSDYRPSLAQTFSDNARPIRFLRLPPRLGVHLKDQATLKARPVHWIAPISWLPCHSSSTLSFP